MVPKKILFVPAIVWVIIIFILLVMPVKEMPSTSMFDVVYFDKWVHAGLFGVLLFLWAYPFLRVKQGSLAFFSLIAFFSVFYGVTMEFVQKYVGRDFDVWDMVADSVGVLIVWLWLRRQVRTRAKRQK